MRFRFVIGVIGGFVQATRADQKEDIPIWCVYNCVVSKFPGGKSFFKVKGVLQVAGKRASRNNRFLVCCCWYCRGVWQRKVDKSKVARNASELWSIAPMSIARCDDLRAKASLSRAS